MYLGQGSFGKVKYAVNRETNEPVAIKVLDKDKIQKKNMGTQIKKEITIMKMIHHHSIVSVKDVFATQQKIYIVLGKYWPCNRCRCCLATDAVRCDE